MRDENDKPIYTYTDEYMRYCFWQSFKGGRCGSFNQSYKSVNSDEVFNNFIKELDINGNTCDILDKFFEFINKHRKLLEAEYDSQIVDHRNISQDEGTKYINDKLSKLTIHEKLQKQNLNNVMMDFDATSLDASAMYDENSVYPKVESGVAFKPHMNDVYVKSFNDQTFDQDCDESAVLKKNNIIHLILYFNVYQSK